VQAPTRRNDPCPCGSGRRYKECHGSLASPGAGIDALIQRSLASHRQGRIDEAERGYREVQSQDPGNAIATHYLGMVAWQRADLATAESMMRESIRANAAIADFHNNLGLLLRDTRRIDEAVACFAKTLEVDPGWYEAHNNLGLALEAGGRWDEAVAAYREAIAAQPAFAAAHQNLGRALLTRGEFAAGWAHYRWRLAAQELARTAPDADAAPLPASLQGRRFVLRSEQGLGDVLFFLRFAPELARRGAALAFRGDARLHAMLARTGLFALGIEGENAPAAPELESVFIGDLPWLLDARDPKRFPDALALAPLPQRVARMRAALEAAGPRPWIALTWRGGVASTGPARTQLKEFEPARLGAALRGLPGTWIGIQRLPRPGELERLSDAIGMGVHDFSGANDDLEDMLALLWLVDEYIGVSNANTHLRASASVEATMQVLVPHPPEWRWMLAGETSPWFRSMRVIRQQPDGRWEALHRR
jgi:tetratricopeptide (TPR) repeat protein